MEDLEILKRYSKFFGFDKKYFELLKSMSFDRLNTANNNSIILTPLLEEICKYALVLAEFNEIELNTIGGVFNNEYQFDKLLEVIDSSFNYISDAIDSECCHPTILTFDSLLNGSDIYDTMVETIYNNPLFFAPERLKSIFDVDKCVTDTEDSILDNFIENMALSNNSIYRIAEILKKAAVDRARNKMLMDRYITYTVNINGSDVQVKASDGITKDLYSDALSVGFKKGKYSINTGIIDEYYDLYKLCQYNYLKNNDKHIKLLEKCKSL